MARRRRSSSRRSSPPIATRDHDRPCQFLLAPAVIGWTHLYYRVMRSAPCLPGRHQRNFFGLFDPLLERTGTALVFGELPFLVDEVPSHHGLIQNRGRFLELLFE